MKKTELKISHYCPFIKVKVHNGHSKLLKRVIDYYIPTPTSVFKRQSLYVSFCLERLQNAKGWGPIFYDSPRFDVYKGVPLWQVIAYPGYKTNANVPDVAILLTEKQLTEKAICLPAKGEQFQGMEGKIYGWGQKYRQDSFLS